MAKKSSSSSKKGSKSKDTLEEEVDKVISVEELEENGLDEEVEGEDLEKVEELEEEEAEVEDELEEEEAEVEDEDVKEELRRKKSKEKPARKKAKSKSAIRRARLKKKQERARRMRRRMVAGVIIVIILMAIVSAWFYMPVPDSLEVRVLNVDEDFDPANGLDIIVESTGGGMRGYTGEIELSTTVNGTETMKQDVDMEGGIAHTKLSYSEFLTENGVYTIEAEVEGVTGSTDVNMKSVVEGISYTLETTSMWYDNQGDLVEGGKTNVTLYFTLVRESPAGNTTITAKEGQFIDIQIDKPDGTTATKELRMDLTPQGKLSYLAGDAGEYRVTATFLNDHIRPDSDFWTVKEEIVFKVNARPLAEAGPDQGPVPIIPFQGAEVTVDGSASFDDGEIVEYEWWFGVYDPDDPEYGEDVVVSSDPTATYTYTETGEYRVTLTVKDDGLPGVEGTEKYGTDSLLITVV